MFKGAIIGFGEVAQKAHAPAFAARKRRFRIEAVVDVSRERLSKAAEVFPKAALYESMDEFLKNASGLDFADIALPPAFHYAAVKKCLRGGLSVLCEKPLVLKTSHLSDIAGTARSGKLSVFTVHNWKYSPQMAKTVKLARSGALGEIRHASFYTMRSRPSFSAAKPWRKDVSIAGGGILIDHGWHIFYLLSSIAGERPVEISAAMDIPEKGGADEEVNCVIKFPSAKCFAHMSWKSPARNNYAFVYGSGGTLEMRDDSILLKKKNGKEKVFRFAAPLSAGSAHPAWMAGMLGDFAETLETGKTGNLEEAQTCLQLIEGAKKSHFSGKSVRIPESRIFTRNR